jgi:hypothetical protein
MGCEVTLQGFLEYNQERETMRLHQRITSTEHKNKFKSSHNAFRSIKSLENVIISHGFDKKLDKLAKLRIM